MKRIVCTLVIPLGMLIICLEAQASPLQISVSPVFQVIGSGGTAEVALGIVGLGDHHAPSLSTFDLEVFFDSTILAFNGFTFGDPVLGDQLDLLQLGSITTTIPGEGSVNVFELSLDPAEILNDDQAPAFELGVLSFGGVTAGTSPVTVTINALGDALGNPLSASTEGGSVTITAIPEPGTDYLLMGGLIGLWLLRRYSA